MAHNKVYGICENKCMVEMSPYEVSSQVNENMATHEQLISRRGVKGRSISYFKGKIESPGHGVTPFIPIPIYFQDDVKPECKIKVKCIIKPNLGSDNYICESWFTSFDESDITSRRINFQLSNDRFDDSDFVDQYVSEYGNVYMLVEVDLFELNGVN